MPVLRTESGTLFSDTFVNYRYAWSTSAVYEMDIPPSVHSGEKARHRPAGRFSIRLRGT